MSAPAPVDLDGATIARLLDVVADDVVPLTSAGVARGNKLFGAAILRGADLSLVVAETNNEVENPLWHGEVHAIKRFFELAATERPTPADCVFLATHEPCSLCLSAVAWSGFGDVSYLFSHQDSADSFAIPHDIAILRGVYAVPDPDRSEVPTGRDLYNRSNDYFTSRSLLAAVEALDEPERPPLRARVEQLATRYAELSATYQAGKGAAGIPHA